MAITPSELRGQANDLRNCAQLPRMHRDTQWEIDAAAVALDQAANLIAAAQTMADAIRAVAQEASVGTDEAGGFARIPRALFNALENALDAATGEYSKDAK